MRVLIPIESQEKMRQINQIEELLKDAGVTFDTGTNACGREWYFDWSIKGAKLKID